MLQRLTDRDLTADIVANASRILKAHFRDPLGTEVPFESHGGQFVARLERHYHPPGGLLKPWGPHVGVSTFRVVAGDSEPTTTRVAPTAGYHLGPRSLQRLIGVHPDLVLVVKRAIELTPIDFTVVEGVRTLARQKQLFAQGSSKTLKSRHLTGHAVDLAPFEGGIVHWDWPRFRVLAAAVARAALDVGVNVEWGGNWEGFPDGPHWQLPLKDYQA